MLDCYKILNIKPGATLSEIRKAYRVLAKKFHPDSSHDFSNTQKFRDLVNAYEILCDPVRRALFDESYFFHPKQNSFQSTNSFDYRKWLCERNDDESLAKLIILDLMRGREDDAVSEFIKINIERPHFRLSRFFTREDFMDFGFILAEELVLRSEYYDAVLVLEQIILMEKTYPYFRNFFPEVVAFAKNVFLFRLEGFLSDELLLDSWERALELGFGKRFERSLWKKMARVYKKIGDTKNAKICLESAFALR